MKEKVAEKHRVHFSFKPEIGYTKYRSVESDKDLFVQRLYDHRLKQEEDQKRLVEQFQVPEKFCNKKLTEKDVNSLLERYNL